MSRDNVTINSIQPGSFDTDRQKVRRSSATAAQRGSRVEAARAEAQARNPGRSLRRSGRIRRALRLPRQRPGGLHHRAEHPDRRRRVPGGVLRRRTLAGRRRRARIRVVSALLGFCAALLRRRSPGRTNSSAPGAKEASSITFDCAGRTSEGRSLPSFASGAEAKFEVSATFGEGAIVALVDPETSAVRQPLYDAESTSGRLRFSDGEETTIVWTRMSGADGALVGEAIMSDGDVLALRSRTGQGAAPPVRPVRRPARRLRGAHRCSRAAGRGSDKRL